MKNILNCEKELRKINSVKNVRSRTLLINKSKKCVINAISEISLNCLKGNVPLTQCQFKNLKPYRRILKKLSNKNFNIRKKKSLIVQRGGFWTYLIPPALSLLSSLASETISRILTKNEKFKKNETSSNRL